VSNVAAHHSLGGLMRRARLAWILPSIFTPLYLISVWVGRHAHSPVHGDIYWRPTFELFSVGLNAPATQLAMIIFGTFPRHIGMLLGDIISSILVAVLWALTGIELDHYVFHEPQADLTLTTGRKLRLWSTMLFGVYLLIFLAFDNLLFRLAPFGGSGGSSNLRGEVVRQILWLIWSLTLIVIPIKRIVHDKRQRSMTLARS